jgi:lysophospholipase L1-like esterase
MIIAPILCLIGSLNVSTLNAGIIGGNPQNSLNIVFDGDSRSLKDKWLVHCMTNSYFSTRPTNYTVTAVSSVTLSGLVAHGPTVVDTLFNPSIHNLCVVWGGINDQTAASTMWINLSNYCTARKSVGFKVIVCTETDGQSTGLDSIHWHDTVYPQFNALIRSNWPAICDAFADLGADPRLQNALDTAYFNVDKKHPSSAGYDVVAGIISSAIATLNP